MPAQILTSILVVEDDAHFRETLRDAMALRQVEVAEAATAAEARDAVARHRPGLVLMDVGLPDANGIELCREFKSSPRFAGVPVILMSARFTEAADRAEGLLAGADSFLAKPVDIDDLWTEMQGLLDKGE